MHRNDCHLTAFMTPWGQYCYCTAPQGYITSGYGYTHWYSVIVTNIPQKTVFWWSPAMVWQHWGEFLQTTLPSHRLLKDWNWFLAVPEVCNCMSPNHFAKNCSGKQQNPHSIWTQTFRSRGRGISWPATTLPKKKRWEEDFEVLHGEWFEGIFTLFILCHCHWWYLLHLFLWEFIPKNSTFFVVYMIFQTSLLRQGPLEVLDNSFCKFQLIMFFLIYSWSLWYDLDHYHSHACFPQGGKCHECFLERCPTLYDDTNDVTSKANNTR